MAVSLSTENNSQSYLLKRFSYVPGGVWIVSICTMLIAVSASMTFSVSPMFMTTVLGLSTFNMGTLEGFSEGLSQITRLFSGVTGDISKKKKPILLFGFILAAISKPIFILSNGWGLVALSKVLERTSNGIMATPRDAYVADESPEKHKGECLGLMMAFKTIGCTIGSLLIAGLLYFSKDYRLLLWIGFVPCILAIGLIYFGLNEKNTTSDSVSETTPNKRRNKINLFALKEIKNLPIQYWTFVVVAALFMCARFSDGLLILRLKELGAPLELCAATVGIFNLISAFCCFPIGKLSDKLGRSSMLYFSFGALIFSQVFFVIANDFWIALIGVLFWGAQRGTSQILFAAYISDVAPKEITGTALGMFYLIIGVIAFGAGSLGGYVGNEHLQYTFVYGTVVSLVAFLGLILWNKFFNLPKAAL